MSEEEDITFESALRELEMLVAAMERGDVPLEELIARYAQGSKLVVRCRSKLAAFEQKIEVLSNAVPPDGEWSESEFPPETTPEAPRRAGRSRPAKKTSDDVTERSVQPDDVLPF